MCKKTYCNHVFSVISVSYFLLFSKNICIIQKKAVPLHAN